MSSEPLLLDDSPAVASQIIGSHLETCHVDEIDEIVSALVILKTMAMLRKSAVTARLKGRIAYAQSREVEIERLYRSLPLRYRW